MLLSTLPVAEGVEHVGQTELSVAIALPLEGQHRVGTQQHPAVHPRREVHAQEREAWIGHLQEQTRSIVVRVTVCIDCRAYIHEVHRHFPGPTHQLSGLSVYTLFHEKMSTFFF